MNFGRKTKQRLPNNLAPAATERPWLPELAVAKMNFDSDRAMPAVHDVGEARAGDVRFAQRTQKLVVDRDHAAQRLEGAEAEALALVLDADLAQAEFRGEAGQGVKRRRAVLGAIRQHGAEFGNAVGIDDELLLAAELQVRPGPGIAGQPGRNHVRS